MKQKLIILFLVVLLLFGCGKELKVSLEDTEPEPEQPVCNSDGICDDGELCDCTDCTKTFECRRESLPPDEYLLKTDMSENIDGKRMTFVNLDSSGKTTISVDGTSRIIENTKFKEIINGLDVMVLETEYNNDRDERIVKIKVKKLNLEPNEYVFDGVGSEMLVESVRIRLNKVEVSSPSDFVRLDVGNVLNQKVKEGETKEIEGLNINVVEVWPKGTPIESYTLLKITKA